jgi:hypothetical protein
MLLMMAAMMMAAMMMAAMIDKITMMMAAL